MKKRITRMIIGGAMLLSSAIEEVSAQEKNGAPNALNATQQSIIPIAAFTANGNQANLKNALNEGLEAGLSINDIKEILVQLYAYVGFPRSLNAINTFESVVIERKSEGINDPEGKEPSKQEFKNGKFEFGKEVVAKLTGSTATGAAQKFVPLIDRFLKEHLFADIFGRDNLDFQTREIATISALASMSGVESQLDSHLNVGKNVGLTEEQLRAIAFTISLKIGWQEGETAAKFLDRIFQSNTHANAITNLQNVVSIQKVTFPNKNITVVGNLYFPKGFDKNKKYPAIIIGHPAGGVKEQTAGHYAELLAEKNYITLAFDASYQGESGGEPRFLEDPAVRTEDFRAATDFLSRHYAVDANRIGVLGICAGGGFAINAAQTEQRLKAIATISMVDLGQLRRDGLNGVLKSQIQPRLDEVAKQRIKEANGEPIRYNNYVANSLNDIPANAPVMYREGYEYYRVSHAHENAPNKYVFTSLDKLINFTALDHVELIAPRPILVIAGSEADSFYFTQEAYDKAKSPKEIFSIKGASHMDLYYKSQYVDQIINKLTNFYGKNL